MSDATITQDSGAHAPDSADCGVCVGTPAASGGSRSLPDAAPIPTTSAPPGGAGDGDDDDDTTGGAGDEHADTDPAVIEARKGRDKAKQRAREAESRAESLQADLESSKVQIAKLTEINQSLTSKLREVRVRDTRAMVEEWIDPRHASMASTVVELLLAEDDPKKRAALLRDRFGSLRKVKAVGGAFVAGGVPGIGQRSVDPPAGLGESPI